ncbi:MAG: class I SAM-dependent methyltransferase [Nitrospirae bacterium]|nr:class I SAM-dependent methyltransferase [Nitrospirota bacterium]MBF0540990.1 class I SAM-dependent methyltransferase [Nitrospirota bacterium]
MPEYGVNTWTDEEFVGNYLTGADIFQVDRPNMINIMKSFYIHFMFNKSNKKILDLGCGDGIMTHEILKIDPEISTTLVDGSDDMLKHAKLRLAEYERLTYIKSILQQLPDNKELKGGFDFIFSSMVIHHLNMKEKTDIFKFIYNNLKPGGYFINLDVVLCPNAALEKWALELWRQRIKAHQQKVSANKDYTNIPDKYKKLEENIPDTLDDQLNAMREIGFKPVDCLYKYGIFTVFVGGR